MRFIRLKRRTEIRKGQIDIAPLVDVMFLLLIFFMLTSNFILQPGIKVHLPQALTSEVIDTENLVITVTAQDLIYVNNKPVQMGVLIEQLKDVAGRGTSLLIKADAGASLGRIVEIWDLCRRYGIERINIATNQKGRRP